MIIQYGKRAGGKIWSTTAARKASARIIRKSQGPVAARRFHSLKSRQRKRKRSIAKVAMSDGSLTFALWLFEPGVRSRLPAVFFWSAFIPETRGLPSPAFSTGIYKHPAPSVQCKDP